MTKKRTYIDVNDNDNKVNMMIIAETTVVIILSTFSTSGHLLYKPLFSRTVIFAFLD